MNFDEIKSAYVEARTNERKKIIKYLKSAGYEVVKGGGAGKSHYTAGGTITPYDLSNWKYIEAYKDGYEYFISFQTFDIDPGTKNHHVLMDRLGLYKYRGDSLKNRDKYYKANDAFTKMVSTNIDLPMNKEKLNKLVLFMETLSVKED